MALETDFNQSPYFDDFDEDKQFHRVLFRPGYAVQARELTQLQTILQNQVERFANEVLVDGTIVTGGGLITDTTNYVKLRDKDANNRVLLLSDFYDGEILANVTITGATSGVTGKLIDAIEGSESAAPNYLTIYCHYTNAGTDNQTKTFADNESLIFRRSDTNDFVVVANTISSAATGKSLKASIDDGIIYHKGHFVKLKSQGIIVGRYESKPNAHIGLETKEYIVDSNQDSDLLDNATGASNYSAPGANRLKLVPKLVVYDLDTTETDSYFRVATIEDGSVVQKRTGTNTMYSDFGKFVSEKIYDVNGDFIVEPFNIRVREHLKKTSSLGRYTEEEGGVYNKLTAEVERGVAYVNGDRVEILNSRYVDIDKANDYDVQDAVVVGHALGNYLICNEVVGFWDIANFQTVELRGGQINAITGTGVNYGNVGTGSTSILGTAKVRGVEYHSGISGTASARYRIYLFDIQMNSGKSFSNVRSLYVNDTTNSAADVVLTNGSCRLQEPNLNQLVYSLGQKGVRALLDSNDSIDTEFVYKKTAEVNFGTSGQGTITVTSSTGGIEGHNDTNIGGNLSNADERNFIIVSQNEVIVNIGNSITNSTGSGSSWTLTGDGNFTTEFIVGDLIQVGGANQAVVTKITSASSMVVTADVGTGTYNKVYPEGYYFDLSTQGTIASNSSTSSTIDLERGTFTSSLICKVHYNVLRSSAVYTSKTAQKNKFIELNTTASGNSNGPWPLGVSDAFKLVAVYKGTAGSVTESDTDVTSHFILDSGMTDSMYDTAKLAKRSDSTLNTNNSGLLVKFHYFGRDYSTGNGYLCVDSYPVQDDESDVGYNADSSIFTQEIPVFKSPATGRTFDLRDSVDYRPYRQSTVTPSSTAASAPLNPSSSATFDGNNFNPVPDETFQADVQYYLPRKDRIVINNGGALQIIRGVPSVTPQTPSQNINGMTLAIVDIPVYPSLSPYVSKNFVRPDYQVKLNIENNRRYTMKDLRAIEDRVKTLEYYSSLNLLESATNNTQVFNEDGQDRFKNGIFVDPMISFVNADTKNPYFRSAIDSNRGMLRPIFERADVPVFMNISSSTARKTGKLISVDYTNKALITQPYSSKLRNPVQELMFNWRGQIDLEPSSDNTPDITTLPEIQMDFSGIYDAFEELAQATGVLGTKTITTNTGWKGLSRTYTDTKITTNISSIQETISTGTQIESISVREFMRSRPIQFTGSRMRPNTRVWAYFDDEKVSDYCTPYTVQWDVTPNPETGYIDGTLVKDGSEGDPLITNEEGTVYGVFRIPDDENLRFRMGVRKFVLQDIENPATESSLVSTVAHGEYSSIPIDITQRGTEVSMEVPQFSQNVQVTTRTLHRVPDGDRSWWDPLAQSFDVSVSGSKDGVYITKIDVFFGKKSSTLPITLQLRTLNNGFPTQDIVPFGQKTLRAVDVKTSSDGSVATTFIFDTPVKLNNNTSYSMVLVPGGNSDEYAVWTAELGGMDTIRPNTLINKQTAAGVLFSSSNDQTWNPIQSEDLKFTIYRASFNASGGTQEVTVENADMEFLTIDNITGKFLPGEVNAGNSNKWFRAGEDVRQVSELAINNTSTLSVGQLLKSKLAQDGANRTTTGYANGVIREIVSGGPAGTTVVKMDAYGDFPTTGDVTVYRNGSSVGSTTAFSPGSAVGKVIFYNGLKGKLYLTESTGGFDDTITNNYLRGQTYAGSAELVSVDDIRMNSCIPRMPTIKHAGTDVKWTARTTTSSGTVSTTFNPIDVGEENFFYDNEKTIFSYSNELTNPSINGKKTFVMKGTMSAGNEFMSPVIDVTRGNIIVIRNVINDPLNDDPSTRDDYDEYKAYGSAKVRYVSKVITLADGQDAEDMSVYLTAYKPIGTNIKVYAKVLNAEDGEGMDTKVFTPLTQITSESVYSSGVDGTDVKEFEFGFSANTDSNFLTDANTFPQLHSGNNNVIAYLGNNDSVYHTYKSFQIKIVMTSSGSHLVPLVDDLRVIALQK